MARNHIEIDIAIGSPSLIRCNLLSTGMNSLVGFHKSCYRNPNPNDG